MHYPLYPSVTVQPSTSSYGRWVIKVSDVTFRFFWHKAEAVAFAAEHNQRHAKHDAYDPYLYQPLYPW